MQVAEHDAFDGNQGTRRDQSRRSEAGLRTRRFAWTPALMMLGALLAPGAWADPVETLLPPLALTADATSGDVILSWYAPPSDVDGYRVYRAESGEDVAANGMGAFVAIGETTTLSFTDASPQAESHDRTLRAIYFVAALIGDRESPPSNLANGQYPACWDVLRPTDCFIP